MRTLRSSALLGLLMLAGCNQILGIDVQNLSDAGERDAGEKDAGQDAGEQIFETPSEAECTAYCDVLDKACDPKGPDAAFKERDYCLGLCSFMQRTPDMNKMGNTFDCRLQRANFARSTVGDNTADCMSSGAGGNDKCGSNCEGYCQLYSAVCADFPDLLRGETCLSECEKLAVDTTKNASAAFSMGADTLQCRLAHLGAAAVDPMLATTHCPHSAIAPASGTPCQPVIPACEQYCALIMNTCTDKLQQYDSENDCLATCKTGLTLTEPLGLDEMFDQTHDTVACRRYHVYNALKNPDSTHCEHGGPSGDGHCGRICPAYCKLAKAACGSVRFNETFAKEQDCLDACGDLIRTRVLAEQLDQHFSVQNAKKGINCRIYHATKAFSDAAGECPSALNLTGGACQ